MAMRILNRSFSGGEITPELFGRLDLSKVQESLALCRNFVTLPHGPAVNRPGTEFVQEVKNSAVATRLIPFSYNANTQTFAIEIGAGYFRWHTQASTLAYTAPDAYVAPATVSITLANPGVVTWNNHGLAAGVPVVFSTTGALPVGALAGETYYVVNPTTSTFQLATSAGGGAISTLAASSTVTITIAAPGVVTWNNHGLSNGTAVVFSTTGALPTGITAGAVYYVVAQTPNTFEIAATPNGTPITTSGAQSGTQTCTTSQAGTQTAAPVYNQGDMCSVAGTNYYCMATTTGNTPVAAAWSNVAAYGVGNTVSYTDGMTYICAVANSGQAPGYTSPANAYWSPIWYTLPADLTYEIPNPYAAADLFNITYTQSADVLTLCNAGYPILELRRYGATNWQLTPVNFGPLIAAPSSAGVAGTPITHTYGIVAFSLRRGYTRNYTGGLPIPHWRHANRICGQRWRHSADRGPNRHWHCDLFLRCDCG